MNSYFALLTVGLLLGAVAGSPGAEVQFRKRDETGTGCNYCAEGPWAFAEGMMIHRTWVKTL